MYEMSSDEIIYVCFNFNKCKIDYRGSYDECVDYVNSHNDDLGIFPEGEE